MNFPLQFNDTLMDKCPTTCIGEVHAAQMKPVNFARHIWQHRATYVHSVVDVARHVDLSPIKSR